MPSSSPNTLPLPLPPSSSNISFNRTKTLETLSCQIPDPTPTPFNPRLLLLQSWFQTAHYHCHPQPGSSPSLTVDLLVSS